MSKMPDDVSEGTPVEAGSPGRKRKKRKAKGSTALSPQRKDPLWKLLEEKIGGRDGLLEAALSSANPKCHELVPYILDKSYKTWGTKKLCEKVGLSALEVGDLFRDRQWLKAYLTLHEELPEVMKDAVADAKATYIACEVCKRATLTKDCYVCNGAGVVRRSGDKDKLAFVGEAAGIVGKKSAPVFQQNIQVNAGPGGAIPFEDLMRKATISVAKKPVAAIEAQVVEESE